MFTFLTTRQKDYADWLDALRDVGEHDIHFTPDYARVQETLGDREAGLCVWRSAVGEIVVQPVVIRTTKIGSKTCHDIESPYGYGGPLCSLSDRDSRESYSDFWVERARWMRERGIVTEWCALHPFFSDRQRWMMGLTPAEFRFVKSIVWMDLRGDFRSAYSRSRSDGVRVAASRGAISVKSRIAQMSHRATFCRLYDETMTRHNASAAWRFPSTYFDAHFDKLDAELFIASVEDREEAAALVLHCGNFAHFHFAGSSSVRHAGVGDLLIDHIAQSSQSIGFPVLHLGGGVTRAADDSLLFFKAGFSPRRAPVWEYRYIVDRARYAEMMIAAGADDQERFFPPYRKNIA